MRAQGLPEAYAEALETGLWPSLDVLTPAEAATRGQRLAPGRTVWRGPAAAGRPAARWPAPGDLGPR